MLRALFVLLLAALALPAHAQRSAAEDCRIGAYRLSGGGAIEVGPTEGGGLRWRRFDGATGALVPTGDRTLYASTLGWTGRADGHVLTFSDCDAGQIRFDGETGIRIRFDITDLIFSDGERMLKGRLVLPRGEGPVPIAVLVTGSEETSALAMSPLQRLLPAEGIGVFVYDKRGTGSSGGAYTQDFDTLARGALAALSQARGIAGARAGRVGFLGLSLGGWVAPIAAQRARVDFVVVGYGLAVSPLEQNRQQIMLELQLAGHGREVIDKALEVSRAAEEIMLSNFTTGFQRFDEVRARYRGEPWWRDLHGNFLHLMLPLDEAGLKANRAQFLVGTPWRYDPMPLLRAARTPQLWILGHDDLRAPSEETSRRITRLAETGRPFTLALVPEADHGLYEYELRDDRSRVNTRVSPVFLPMVRDFIRQGRLTASYGPTLIVRPAAAPTR
jgi:dienelactone hydrolase